MTIKNFYLILAGLLLAGFTSCKKKDVLPGNSGNVPGDTVVSTGKALPAGAKDGVTFVNSGKSVIFNLYAPGKKSVSVIGDFNGWDINDTKGVMNNTPDGKRWWIQIDNIDPATEYGYQYYIDKSLKVADPYTEKVLDPNNDSYISSDTYPGLKAYPTGKTTGNVSVLQANQPTYTWKNGSFTRPDKKNLVVYELLLRDFVNAHNYQTLKDTLKYLSNLGVNAIELMPINEFEGNLSWGYNPSFYFAPDKYYGTKNALKAFIDECHSRGIAVIQDIVLNHSFGQSPMVQMYFNSAATKPSADNPWYNVDPTHPYNVGYQFNHESAATKYFVKNVLKFWMTEYKIDGFRFDLSKGFTQVNYGTTEDDAHVTAWSQYDASRVAIWKEYNNYIKSIDNNNFYVILEHFAVNQEEKELAGEGMMLWNNLNYNANEATMGWLTNSNFQGLFYEQHTFTQPYNLVSYFESHDQERLQFKNESYGNAVGSYNVKDKNTGLARNEMAAAFLFSVPGPKMLWQFGELGYDVSIDQGGRTSNKPIYWNYNTDPNRKQLYKVYAKMIKMKEKNAVFASTNYSYNLNGAIKTIQLKDASANVEVVGNFDVVQQTGSISFPATGTWYDNISGTSINVTSVPFSITLAPGEYHVYSSVALNQ